MLVREWITDENGRLTAIWVKREVVFTETHDAPGDINTAAADSGVPTADSTHAAARSLQVSEQNCEAIAAA